MPEPSFHFFESFEEGVLKGRKPLQVCTYGHTFDVELFKHQSHMVKEHNRGAEEMSLDDSFGSNVERSKRLFKRLGLSKAGAHSVWP